LFAPSIPVTSNVLKHHFQLGQPLFSQGETGAQLGHGLDRSRERVDTRRLGAVPAREEPTRDRASAFAMRGDEERGVQTILSGRFP
jgi:hypothetical protein